jgi:peptidoglycan hydrolase-like protein with peptidoglycan-binding domain
LGRYTACTKKLVITGCIGLLLGLPAWAKTAKRSTRHSSSSSKSTSTATAGKKHRAGTKKVNSKKQAWRTRQAAIDNTRVREIQGALIRSHYMDGQPTGAWDARTKSAMEKFQADNGWQTKKVPDSRALIKLGLGPDRANLINPETAFVAQPEPGKGGSQTRE